MTISATVISDSISSVTGQRITTFEWVYPRIVLAEVNTHRELSKNSSSSRAIPVKKNNELIRSNIARPFRFGKANPGMQDAGEHDTLINGYTPEEWWDLMVSSAIAFSQGFEEAGYAKQICNRGPEMGSHMKTVVTSTSYDNFNWLRNHDAADPTIAELARVSKKALDASTPVVLKPGDWHTPYYGEGFWRDSNYLNNNMEALFNKRDPSSTLVNALAISSSCCAQVSFRTADDTLEKALKVKERLVQANAVHGSPFEHQATPIKEEVDTKRVKINTINPETWEEGITHMRRDGTLCSGNLRNWRQHRQLIPGHDYESSVRNLSD